LLPPSRRGRLARAHRPERARLGSPLRICDRRRRCGRPRAQARSCRRRLRVHLVRRAPRSDRSCRRFACGTHPSCSPATVVTHLLAFLGVATLVIVTPGPDTALTIRNTLVGGRRAGVRTAAGVASGQAGWTVAASAGRAALLR